MKLKCIAIGLSALMLLTAGPMPAPDAASAANIMGDVNSDGILNREDAVLLQNWIAGMPETVLADPSAADLSGDGRLNSIDLTLLKRQLLFGTVLLPDEKDRLPEKHCILPPAHYAEIGGAAALNGSLDIKSRKEEVYYRINDVYHMKSDQTLTIIPNYETYQQTTDYTCGVSNLVMLMQHYGWYDESLYDERTLAAKTGTSPQNGVSAQDLGAYMQSLGWNVEVSTWKNMPFDFRTDYGTAISRFAEWVISHLRNDQPIMVDWNDWGGHWQTIIGYDTMGTYSTDDDVLILADPFDTTDHYQDGYYVFSASRFLKMWTDSSVNEIGGNTQQYLIAYPNEKYNRPVSQQEAFAVRQEVFPQKHTVGYPESYTEFGGAAWADGRYDMDRNRDAKYQYFIAPDVFAMKSDDTLTITEEYKTYQQTTGYTCGVSNMIMLLEHYHNDGPEAYDELVLAERTGTSAGNGVSAQDLAAYIAQYNYRTTVSRWANMPFDFRTNGFGPEMSRFAEWVIGNLQNDCPVMVDWNDWGGHWQTIIGYDTMGTYSTDDDVLIFADPFDTTDHYQDGYYIFSASRFLKMWADASVQVVGGSTQQYLTFQPNS